MSYLAASLVAAWFGAALLFRSRLAPDWFPESGPSVVFLWRPAFGPPGPPPDEPVFQLTDVLLPAALILWIVSLQAVKVDAVDDWGLLHALPVAFFVAVGLLVVSIAVTVMRPALSVVRLGLHLVALVVVLHGTVPLIFPEPNYPWVYKHIGVTDYINARGALNAKVDIYQNWPGFFALAAWFTRIGGAGSPLVFAKWAPVYFNLIYCLELTFVFRHLPLRQRERWVAMFLFVAGNWVGQDYFAPQALAFALSLAVFGMILAWLHTDGCTAPARLGLRVAPWTSKATPAGEEQYGQAQLSGWLRAVALASLFILFAVLVVVHQLSPFLVLLGLGLLAAGGMVRPRWVVVVLASLALGYFALHVGYLRSEGHLAGSPFNPRDLLASLSNPFNNLHSGGFRSTHPMPGRALTALGSPALIFGLWALGFIGTARRLWAGRRTLILAILAGSPALIAAGENYGGEAIFRIFLFSLPWTAALAASALAPHNDRWPRWAFVRMASVLSVVAVLFMSAFYGSVELYRVRPGAVQASQYYFAHAPPGSVLGLAGPNVPGRIGANYDQFVKGTAPPPLSTVEELRNRQLGQADVATVSKLYRAKVAGTSGGVFLSLSSDQDTYLRVLGLLPEGSLGGLDRALAQSPDWRVFYRNSDAVIYQFVGR